MTADPDRSTRRLLAALGTAMIATGQPIDEIEDELRAVGRHFGHPDVQVGAGPTGLYLALASGDPATFASVAGGLRLDQAADVRLIRHLVATDQLGVEPAIVRLRELPGKPPRYPRWLADLGFIGIAVGICLILQPALPNVAAAALGGAIVVGLSRVAQRYPRCCRCCRRPPRSWCPAWCSRPRTRGCSRARCAPFFRRSRCCCRARCW